MANKNSYEKKAHRKQMLNGMSLSDTNTKGDIGKSSLAMLRDIILGGLAGTAAGAICGRYSFFPGALISGGGHYIGQPGLTAFGIGMMASGNYKAAGVNGMANGFEGVKDRLTALKEDLKQKFFLDKIIKSKKASESTEEGTNGMGDVQYFNYPLNKELQGKPLDFSALNHIEKQIEMAAQKHSQMQGTEDMEGIEGIEGMEGHDDDMSGVEDYNL